MIRILSSKRYWSLISKIADDQQTIKDQAKLISRQDETIQKQLYSIEYLNDKLNKRNDELLKYRLKDLDFPATQKIYDADINKLLKL